MKKLLGLVSLAALMVGAASTAQAQGYYIEGSVGITTQDQLEWNNLDYDTDDGWNAGVAIGRQMWTNWDGEVEFSYDEMEYSCCNPNNTSEYRLMANLTRNFDVGGFVPYAGGGVGAAWVKYENQFPYEREDTVLAYQLIGGVRVALGDQWSLFGEYRYHGLFQQAEDSGTPGGSTEWDHSGHDFTFGARLNLN